MTSRQEAAADRWSVDRQGRGWGGARSFLLPLALTVIQVGGTFGAAHNQSDRSPVDGLAIALLLAGPVVLLARHRYPLVTLAVVDAISLAYLLLGYPYGPFVLSFLVATFGAVLSGHRVAAWVGTALLYVGHLGLGILLGLVEAPGWTAATAVAAWMIIILAVAEIVRVRREQLQAARRARQADVDRRADQERVRIARELHDVVAHNISMINVQAGVALHVMDARPEQARTALTAIKQASKEALVELRSVLGVLRQVDDELPRQPSPGLERLPDLVDRTRVAGIDAELRVEGTARAVPANVDLAAFRIVQEALTNVVRHAGATRAWVTLTYEDGHVGVQIDDDGRGTPTTDLPSGGAGITGMRERAVALSGEFEAGPRAVGYRVRARLPLRPDEEAMA